jgi:site-specific DNA recombinase
MKQIDTTKLRYFIYARKSSESEERQARSIEDQLRETWDIARREQLVIVGEYTEAQTASKPGRPKFAEMLARMEAGEADAILAWEPNRLARNSIDGGRVIYMLDSGAIKHLSFANYHFTNDSHGKFALYMAFAQSKYYTDNLSENVRRGIRQRIARGIYPGRAKRGYLNHAKTREIIPDPPIFKLIAQMFNDYASEDVSLELLGQRMFDLGLQNGVARPLSSSQVQLVLTDPFYYGAFIYNGELHLGIHEPAVSKSLWDKVQAKMRQRGKLKTYKKTMKVFAFRGFMRCAECGRAITVERQKGHVYYHCTKHGKIPCGQPSLREESLAGQLNEVMARIDLPDRWIERMLAEIEKAESESESRISGRISELDAEFGTIQSRLSRLADLYTDGEIDRADYNARKSLLIDRKVALVERKREFATDGGSRMFELMRQPLKLVQDWKNAPAGGDLSKLRALAAQVGSNWVLDSRKVLWDWVSPYALLAERASYTNWLGSKDSNLDAQLQRLLCYRYTTPQWAGIITAMMLAQFLGIDQPALRILAEEAAGELRALGLDILDAAGGYRMLSAAQWDPWLGAFHRQVRKAKLGKSALEILAVIAYEQPVSRERVDELRQVNSESIVRALLDRRLITVSGRWTRGARRREKAFCTSMARWMSRSAPLGLRLADSGPRRASWPARPGCPAIPPCRR